MTTRSDVITISRQKLLEFLTELEHQYTVEFVHLTACLAQLEQTYQILHRVIEAGKISTAKQSLVELLFPNNGVIITDRLFDTWAQEAEKEQQSILEEGFSVYQGGEEPCL